jgi:hypothetical protein
MRSTSVIVDEGVNCFLREPFDYTKWRRDNLYEDLSLSELNKKAAEFAKDNS